MNLSLRKGQNNPFILQNEGRLRHYHEKLEPINLYQIEPQENVPSGSKFACCTYQVEKRGGSVKHKREIKALSKFLPQSVQVPNDHWN